MKKAILVGMCSVLLSQNLLAITNSEAIALMEASKAQAARSTQAKIASNTAILKEIESLRNAIDELKEDVRINGADTSRSLWISAGLAAFVVVSGQILNSRTLGIGAKLGGDRAGAAAIQGGIFLIFGSASAASLINAGINKAIVISDESKLKELESKLLEAHIKLTMENQNLR